MKTKIAVSCWLFAAVFVAGCGPSSPGTIAPVSGKLTLDGKPFPNVEIVFSPIASSDNGNPGPYSVATTGDDGSFEMKTRYKETGAVVGRHNVTMAYPDIQPGAMEELVGELRDSKQSGGEGSAELMAEIAALKKKLKGRPMIPSSATQVFEVPAGGNKSVAFDLKSD